ncbi:MAG: Uma2 family endonuclease [Cyanobacteria bacterium SBLK]|nr:Uma2 family endonuclease [Cyanobacteria bacterium SBLK]
MTLTLAKWTLDDYHHMIKAGILTEKNVELIAGEIVEMSPEGELHAYTNDEAGEYLVYLLGNLAKVRQGKPIAIPENASEPQPDLAIVERLGRNYRDRHPHPENIFWLIEYSYSTLTTDLQVKNHLYGAAGIPEYWIADLRSLELIVLREPTENGYQSRETYRQGTICSLAFPDIEISIEQILGI